VPSAGSRSLEPDGAVADGTDRSNPPRTLARAELHFSGSLFDGRNLVYFAV